MLGNKVKHEEEEMAQKEKEMGIQHEHVESENLLQDVDEDLIF